VEHQVTIGKEYYLGVTEVTQEQYKKVMGTNPSYFQKRVSRKSDSSGNQPNRELPRAQRSGARV
jgi:formylglycine-generating enzyme required for sulfatase activity